MCEKSKFCKEKFLFLFQLPFCAGSPCFDHVQYQYNFVTLDSTMYDDWMLHSDFHQDKASQASLAVPKTRKRAKSILQSVATDTKGYNSSSSLKTNIPEEADVPRRRANSLTIKQLTAKELRIEEYPFTRTEIKKFEKDLLDEDDDDDSAIDKANDIDFLSFRDATYLHIFSCDNLLDQTNETLEYVKQLSVGFNKVQKQTDELRTSCNDILAEQERLNNLCLDIDENLKIFENLDNITRKLNAPGFDLVIQPSFITLLDQLDEGLKYVQVHVKFKNIEIYQQRFRHCMTRALSLIQVYIQNVLKDLENEAYANSQKVTNLAALNIFLFSKFEAESSTIFKLTQEIARRGETHEEYEELLLDVMRDYFAIRSKLLFPQINKNFEESSKDQSGIVQFTRSNLSFYKDLCQQEYKLFYMFFSTGENAVIDWLQELCSTLYDTVRQRVIRETDINLLCELTSLLLEYKEDDDSDSIILSDNGRAQDEEDIDFFALFSPILKDTQQRLIFQIIAFIDTEIVRHVPKEQDLYGLSHRRGKKKNDSNATTELQGSKDYDTEALFKDWYPPMKKAVLLLSQIYQLVSSTVFDDLAHRIVHECLGSLQNAHTLAVTRIGKLEADLFLIKHLLLLRQQIQEFDIEYVPAEVQFDFSGLAEVFDVVRREGVSLSTSNLLNLAKLSVPKVVNNMVDAKEELYAKLRNAVHEVTEEAVKAIVGSITGSTIDLTKVAEQTRQLREDASKELPRLRSVMSGYIDDGRTVDILVDSVQDLVIQAYEKYHEEVVKEALKNNVSLENVMEVEGLVTWFGEMNSNLRKASISSEGI